MTRQLSAKTTILAIVLILLGVLILILPWYILPVCEAADQKMSGMAEMHSSSGIMKCGYTARAEIGIGAVLVLIGLAVLLFPGRDARRAVGIPTIGLGAVTILLPTILIGVCSAPAAPCAVGTKPGLILLGTLTMLTGVILIFSRDGTGPQSGET